MSKFMVLKCYSDTCSKYQVHQSKKWKCKVCDEAQSLKRIYFESDMAKDCREVCQKLNTRQATKDSSVNATKSEPSFKIASNLNSSKRFEPFKAKVSPPLQEIKKKSSIDEELERCLDLFDMEPHLDQSKISSQRNGSTVASVVEDDHFKDSKWNEYLSD
ncbi:hypothetical protein CONCODRAFT_12498 [Conidiobolus coronatus NRRL 28638]|uniref:MRN complex-interacting protein N-terminal domain-containing protein n=1 Tax=Conidiobolus coronatus (strain ATCC 28846 / CBS 209.66 / NRRL 28638) TaxID=796925 RepID=A0A137NSU3_CONC2|nr:hypothetical protein CONCODRAFT_12498 [Conidiobolus coronatus NRRL 28638]|eukprot:KXN65809.1 hypothetical protein CONCODRAFT_12498 [Conidiobolus coronatus NRRL 28638]